MTHQSKIDKSIAPKKAQIMQKVFKEAHIEQKAPKEIHIEQMTLKRHRYLKILRSQ